MPTTERYIALDLGASGGRVMQGTLADGRLRLDEAHRFPNGPVQVLDSLYWDVVRLWEEVKLGLARVAAHSGPDLAGIGVDTWALDFGLVDQRGELLGLPHTYRDARTVGILEVLAEHISESDLYRRTGMSFIEFGSLGQLLAMRRQESPALDVADALLFIPNLFLFWLCGRRTAEVTVASHSQLYDIATGDWCWPLLAEVGLPAGIMPEMVPTATVLGPLLPSVGQEVGLSDVPVIATACHDTAAASAAVPSDQKHFTFISSGTWSVLGTELLEPILTEDALRSQFMNEGGACGRIILVRNSMGLWPVQECRRVWRQEGHAWDYPELTEMAAQAPPFAAVVDPDDAIFFQPGDTAAKVAEFCCLTGQESPTTPGSIIRSLLEGLALRYRKTIQDLERVTSRPTDAIHIVGGGSQNALLCQLAADATSRPVVAGPTEATASGTVLLQALALGHLGSLAELREVVRRSFGPLTYDPRPAGQWDEAYDTFLRLGEST